MRETASYELSCVKIGSAIFAVGDDKNKKGKVSLQKVTNRYISRICGKAPSDPILAKFGMSREVADVITPKTILVFRN